MWLSFYQFTEWPEFIESLVHRFGYTENALKVFDEMPDVQKLQMTKKFIIPLIIRYYLFKQSLMLMSHLVLRMLKWIY